MSDKDTPMWASISNDGGRFTVYYKEHGIYSDSRLEGYSINAFKDCPNDLPVVRFDKAKYEDVCAWLRENNIIVRGHGKPLFGWKYLSLEEYLDILGTYDILYQPMSNVVEEFQCQIN